MKRKTTKRTLAPVRVAIVTDWLGGGGQTGEQEAANIQKRVGFHTFRHTHTNLLTHNNEEVNVRELLRHADSRITLDFYAQAGMPNKRLAQSKLVRLVLNKGPAET